MKPVIATWVPTVPSEGDMSVTDSTVHVVERKSVGSDDVGTDSEHELALRGVEAQDEVGIGTKNFKQN